MYCWILMHRKGLGGERTGPKEAGVAMCGIKISAVRRLIVTVLM